MSANDKALKALLSFKETIVENFTEENWLELGILTECAELVQGHGRLLRSLSWGDEDYSGCVLNVLMGMHDRDATNIKRIEDYLNNHWGSCGGESASSEEATGPRVYITPQVFDIPDDKPDPKLVSVMMPFSSDFKPVYKSIKNAVHCNLLKCQRVDDIWIHSVIIQDVFSLIYRSFIVVCDFSGKNPNVFYEAGIAHTLGKHVIPIAQSENDIPFDLRHHRHILYLNNAEGRDELELKLNQRINTLRGPL